MTNDDPMPVFVLKGKDRLALGAISQYSLLCLKAGLIDQAAEVDKAYAEIRAWQGRHPELMKLPDHEHVPAVVTG